MPIKWSELLLTGVPEIDKQHLNLFTVVNSFVQSIMDENDKQEVDKLYTFLSEYVVLHFTTEEQMLERECYPAAELAVHKAQHAYFTRAFCALKRRYDLLGHSPELVRDTHRDVSNWLLTHVAKADIIWSAHLKEKRENKK
ncbi:MAG: bacteriohemerythrin [Elusimicrobiales bacterium]|nr:bacteriohemerythrin [Elusimicrobiales bacterium]